MVWKLCFNWYYNTCCCCCIRRWSARAAIRAPTEAALKITIVCTSSHFINWSEDDNKLSKQVKTGFKRIIKWNKYRSEMTKQTKTNNFLN